MSRIEMIYFVLETEEKSPKWIEEPDGTSNSSLELLCSSKDKEEQNSNSSGKNPILELLIHLNLLNSL